MTVAQTILEQLGGRRFTQMTGAKNYVDYGNALSFHLGRNSSRANLVKIILEANDTYTVEFSRFSMRTLDVKLLDSISDVYADQLQEIFTRKTGLYTSL